MKDDDARRLRHLSTERPTVRVPSGVDPSVEASTGLRLASLTVSDAPPSPSPSSSLEKTPAARGMLELPEELFFARLDERARRLELMLVLLQTGALSRPIAGRALQAQLEAIRRGALVLGTPQLAALIAAISGAVGELAQLPRGASAPPARDVIVLDEDEVSRDLVALAMEAEGHAVRCAATFDEMVTLFDERRPDIVVSDVELSNAPARIFCQTLADVLGDVPIILFASRLDGDVLSAASLAGVSSVVPKESGIEVLLAELTTMIGPVASPKEGGDG